MTKLDYKDMTKFFKEKTIGDYSINKFKIENNNIGAIIRGIPEGEYVLLKGPSVLMSNTPMEQRTNREFIDKANGDVLIGGLGIGLIILPIQDKENVKSITIIEKNKEVIELVSEQLPLNNKVNIIHSDIFNFMPDKKYDTIYLDIWPYVNSDIYENEMIPLKNKYSKYLVSKNKNPDRFIKCWAESEAKANLHLY